MNYRQIPNILSFLRIILSCFFALEFNNLLNNNHSILLPFTIFIIILVTDYFDGFIARKTSNTSSFGALLDVSADMIFVILSYLTLTINHMLHPFFIFVLILKFIEFIYTSNKKDTSKRVVFDTIGKYVSIFWIVFPGIICILCYMNIENLTLIINSIVIVTTILALISTITRLYSMGR